MTGSKKSVRSAAKTIIFERKIESKAISGQNATLKKGSSYTASWALGMEMRYILISMFRGAD
jgi:hypothetical protein